MDIRPLEKIKEIQLEYKEFVFGYKSLFQENEVNAKKIPMFLDEVKLFWLERLDIIGFELEELTEKNLCFVLSGAIFLDVSGYEHFYFKSLGDYHLLFDPFLKMEHFFRVPEEKFDPTETIEFFKRVLSDTKKILSQYEGLFFILPIKELAVKDQNEHNDLLQQNFISILSSLFNRKFIDQEDFCNQYHSFEQIERDITPFACENLIFSEHDTKEMTIREKLKGYCESEMIFLDLSENQSESQIFLLSLFSWFSQIIDILLISLYLRTVPYIRFRITFNYLLLIMPPFLEDRKLKEIIEQVIVFYIFRKIIDEENFKDKNFTEYSMTMRNQSLLTKILDKMRKDQVDIFRDGLEKVELIIQEEFTRC